MTSPFTSEYKVTIGDINYGGHMGNDKALLVFQDARLNFLNSLGFSELNIGEECGIIMVESTVRYKREVFHGDLLKTGITLSELKAKKFTLAYTVSRLPKDEIVFSGVTTFLAFNYDKRKVVQVPEAFRKKAEGFLLD